MINKILNTLSKLKEEIFTVFVSVFLSALFTFFITNYQIKISQRDSLNQQKYELTRDFIKLSAEHLITRKRLYDSQFSEQILTLVNDTAPNSLEVIVLENQDLKRFSDVNSSLLNLYSQQSSELHAVLTLMPKYFEFNDDKVSLCLLTLWNGFNYNEEHMLKRFKKLHSQKVSGNVLYDTLKQEMENKYFDPFEEASSNLTELLLKSL